MHEVCAAEPIRRKLEAVDSSRAPVAEPVIPKAAGNVGIEEVRRVGTIHDRIPCHEVFTHQGSRDSRFHQLV